MKLHKVTAAFLSVAFAQVAFAQTTDSSGASGMPAANAGATVEANAPALSTTTSAMVAAPAAPGSNDPLIQKRIADKQAKDEYKMRKEVAKKEHTAEKKAAKEELKASKKQAKEERNEELRSERAVQ